MLSWSVDINDFYEQIDHNQRWGRLGKLSLGRIVTGNAKGNVKENEERYKVEEDTGNMNENMEENMDEGTAETEDLEARDEVFESFLVALISILIHETAHIAAALILRIKPRGIKLCRLA